MAQTFTEVSGKQKLSGLAGAVIWRYVSMLPARIRWHVGGTLGFILYLLVPKRRRIALRNLELCFPNYSSDRRRKIALDCFRHCGRGIFAWGFAMFSNSKQFKREVSWHGRDHLQPFIDNKQSVILLCPHLTCALILLRAVCNIAPATTIYKAPKNPIFDMIYRRCFRNETSPFSWLNRMFRMNAPYRVTLVRFHESLRQLYKAMSAGEVLFYLPDQNASFQQRKLFVPFFGIQCATYNGLTRISQYHNARIFMCHTLQLPKANGYEIHTRLLPENFITGDPLEDATKMNREIEKIVETMPEQYFWLHRKFQSRPPGEKPIYQN